MASSKSDPTPLNAVLSSPKHIFDDTRSIDKRPIQKVSPSRNNCNNYSPTHTSTPQNNATLNGNGIDYNGKSSSKYIQDYIKPKSPMKNSTGNFIYNKLVKLDFFLYFNYDFFFCRNFGS